MRWMSVSTVCLSCAVAVAACSGSSPAPVAEPAASAPVPTAPSASPTPEVPVSTAEPSAASGGAAPAAVAASRWAGLSREEKMEVMKTAVMPKMTPLFQQMDPKRFAKVTCGTCHGSGAKDGTFAMPTASILKLTADGSFARELEKYPAVTKVMMERVVPDMSSALGVAPYDPSTKQGFGCFNCHMPKK